MTTDTQNLKKSVLKGSAWTIASTATSQTLRFGKSLILTRLLFPEAYGVMTIVWSILYVINMLSDAGLSAAAIRHPRGGDPDFLNTLWSAKVMRGAIIFIITCAIAYPIASFYKMPDLLWLVPIAGCTTLISGFDSTNIYVLQRKMQYKLTSLLTLSNEIIVTILTIAWAYFYPGLGPLIGGAIIGTLYNLYVSHALLPGARNKFHWDTHAAKDLFHFGKWIFFSSIVYLIYAQGDKMVLGKYLDTKLLGIYSIAIMISEIISGVISKLNTGVFYTALSQIINNEKSRLKSTFYKLRLGIDLSLIIPIGILMMVSENVVHVLYDVRYHAAGWMLKILCIRLIMIAMLSSSESCLFSLGKPQYAVVQNICRAIWILIGVPLGWQYYGIEGVVWTVASTEVPVWIVLWIGMTKVKLLSLSYELRSLGCALLGIMLGYFLNKLLF
jgi:O-antigen/teichoic acid export membrane protein